jgi:hypothetical protein
LLILAIVHISINCVAGEAIIIDDFEEGLKPLWKSREIHGETRYHVIKTENNHVLKAASNASASALIYKYKYNLKEYPILTWKWKIENTIKNGDVMKKGGNDCAARVYVIFPSWVLWHTKSITYIWANKLPKGKYVPSPHYSKSMVIAVESGNEHLGKWVTERRNVYEDFKMIFGEEPPRVGGIAIMTDTDNTGESAIAYYDELKIEKP